MTSTSKRIIEDTAKVLQALWRIRQYDGTGCPHKKRRGNQPQKQPEFAYFDKVWHPDAKEGNQMKLEASLEKYCSTNDAGNN